MEIYDIEKIKTYTVEQIDAMSINELKAKFLKLQIIAKDGNNIINSLVKTNKELMTISQMQKFRIEVIDERELISKAKIRQFIKENLPDDEIMECCSNYDVNGVAIRKGLEKLLENKEIN